MCSHRILLPHCPLRALMLIQFLPDDGKVVDDASPGFADKGCIVNVLGRQEQEDVLSDDGETVLVETGDNVLCIGKVWLLEGVAGREVEPRTNNSCAKPLLGHGGRQVQRCQGTHSQ